MTDRRTYIAFGVKDFNIFIDRLPSARPVGLVDNWVTNGVNRKVSPWFGYGLMDAAAMADLAANWTLVPPQHICKITSLERNRFVSRRCVL